MSTEKPSKQFIFDPIEEATSLEEKLFHYNYLSIVAKKTVPDHLFAVIWYLFHLEFLFALDHAMWAIERLFEIGNYRMGGLWSKYQIRWWTKDPDKLPPELISEKKPDDD